MFSRNSLASTVSSGRWLNRRSIRSTYRSMFEVDSCSALLVYYCLTRNLDEADWRTCSVNCKECYWSMATHWTRSIPEFDREQNDYGRQRSNDENLRMIQWMEVEGWRWGTLLLVGLPMKSLVVGERLGVPLRNDRTKRPERLCTFGVWWWTRSWLILFISSFSSHSTRFISRSSNCCSHCFNWTRWWFCSRESWIIACSRSRIS